MVALKYLLKNYLVVFNIKSFDVRWLSWYFLAIVPINTPLPPVSRTVLYIRMEFSEDASSGWSA